MNSALSGDYSSQVIWMAGGASSGVRCERCNTAFGIIDGDPQLTHLDRHRYALCENCVIEVGDWERILADLYELCGCAGCWSELERLWEDGENRVHERRSVGGC
ncbi:MAG TPA: hypothetical protein VLG28_16905 [Acidimicrobiia bacterium]|nr:hypothetical protein [Acidimicrobiia bacterium]